MKVVSARLAGRCANGAERDGGRIYHAVALVGECSLGGVALCGKTYGRKSAGFVWETAPVTCPRCKKKMEKLTQEVI